MRPACRPPRQRPARRGVPARSGYGGDCHGADDVDRRVGVGGDARRAHGQGERHEHRTPAAREQEDGGRPRRFVERQSGVTVDCLVTGRYPGTGQPGPIAFPDPLSASQDIESLRVITLPHLIQLKLAARRYYDFGDVAFLIRVHNLDESFLPSLHPSLHQDFIECLEEKRREEEYEARG